jgi:hypothetical protein
MVEYYVAKSMGDDSHVVYVQRSFDYAYDDPWYSGYYYHYGHYPRGYWIAGSVFVFILSIGSIILLVWLLWSLLEPSPSSKKRSLKTIYYVTEEPAPPSPKPDKHQSPDGQDPTAAVQDEASPSQHGKSSEYPGTEQV